jgi:hypothetical protein
LSGTSPMGVVGPQASSCDYANIIVIMASPSAFIPAPCLLFLNRSLCEVLVVHYVIGVV